MHKYKQCTVEAFFAFGIRNVCYTKVRVISHSSRNWKLDVTIGFNNKGGSVMKYRY